MTYFDFIRWISTTDACITFPGSLNAAGYGQVRAFGSVRLAHRVSYMVHEGAIPDGTELDHLCRNRACINPRHLEPVSHLENVRRGKGPETSGAHLRALTECKRGHPLSGPNLYIKTDGHRMCRECKTFRQRRRRARLASERGAAQ